MGILTYDTPVTPPQCCAGHVGGPISDEIRLSAVEAVWFPRAQNVTSESVLCEVTRSQPQQATPPLAHELGSPRSYE